MGNIRVAWYWKYANPATVAPPNMAGILTSFMASFGSIRAKEIDRTAGTLCIEFEPTGQARPRRAAPLFARSRPPVLDPALWTWRARCPFRNSGPSLWERILPLMIVVMAFNKQV